MKQLLLIFICVLFVFNSKAQDTSYYDGVAVSLDSIGIDTAHYYPSFGLGSTMTIRKDTVPVIMAVSDTSLRKADMPLLWQQRGYSVGNRFFIDTYLDEDKKPLGKNIIVWMSMPTESTNRKYIGL